MSSPRVATKTVVWIAASLVWVAVLLVLALMATAGQPDKIKTLEFSGTAPVGVYTWPSNFAQGRSPGSGFSQMGAEITRDQLTNTATLVELVIEVSFDGGTSWPPGCVSATTCLCHNASQDGIQPANTQWCSRTLQGGTWPDSASMECFWNRVSDAQTRIRGRLNVCGASATGSIYTTWR